MQRNLLLVNDLFRSNRSVANCMTDRASVHTGNATERFLHRSETLILVHTVTERFSKRKGAEQKPIRHSVNIASDTGLTKLWYFV